MGPPGAPGGPPLTQGFLPAATICHIWHPVSFLWFNPLRTIFWATRFVAGSKRIYLFKLFHGNEILGAHYMIEYFVKNSKSDENHSKILQNHIVTEVDNLRAIFKLWHSLMVKNASILFIHFHGNKFWACADACAKYSNILWNLQNLRKIASKSHF